MSKHKLYIIDDDVEILDSIVSFFDPQAFELTTYGNAEDALLALTNRPDACDAILVDFNLPEMNGIEFSLALINRGLTMPIIMMTSDRSAEMALRARNAGVFDFVTKPLRLPQLLGGVDRALKVNGIQVEHQPHATAVVDTDHSVHGIVGQAPKFLHVLDLAKRVADSKAHVLITGESGTGKEVIAKAVHNFGHRQQRRFVAINCSAIPEDLLEAELFGYNKGAFTGAVEKRIGLFEEAAGGTLFLDEIGDLSLPMQAKLLRVLQDKKIKRLGENQMRSIDVRVVSATHKNLTQEVAENRFREDLFFRLNVIPIALPPLRDRQEDIVPLADFFLRKHAVLNRVDVKGFTNAAVKHLLKRPWKGNVRELENLVERAVVLSRSNMIDLADLTFDDDLMPSAGAAWPEPSRAGGHFDLIDGKIMPLDDLINKYIVFALEVNRGAKDRTARDLGVDRKTLYRRVREMQQLERRTTQDH